jgi:hypothetical protein
MSLALVYSLAVCALSVALEGLFAGGSIKQRLATLQVPGHVPPLWGWIVTSVIYYVICFVLLYRLFSMPTLKCANRRARAASRGRIDLWKSNCRCGA